MCAVVMLNERNGLFSCLPLVHAEEINRFGYSVVSAKPFTEACLQGGSPPCPEGGATVKGRAAGRGQEGRRRQRKLP